MLGRMKSGGRTNTQMNCFVFFLRSGFAGLFVLMAIPMLNGLAAEGTLKKPNVIWAMADDLGYGDLGCYGQKKIKTPNIDRMAAEGMRFTQFYAGSTVCAPSRCVLMTGLHTGHGRVRGNALVPLRAEDFTVAELFKQAGYTTGLVGKWGLGEAGSTGIPNKKGFDYFYGYLNQLHAHNQYPEFLWRNEAQVKLQNVVTAVGTGGGGYATKGVDYAQDLFAEEALSFLDRSKDKPFFLYLAWTVPHANNERTKALGDGQEVPDYGIYKDEPWSQPNKGQAAMITRLDSYMGRIFERLKKLGLDENTLVVFTSDNGPHKEGGNDPEFFDANGPVRGIKRDMYDGGIRIPFIVRWPGKIKAGVVSQHMGYFGDFMATVGELVKVKPPEHLDSMSFLPVLLGDTANQKQHDALYWEFHEKGFNTAVLMGKWKAVRLRRRDAPLELYDLSKDTGEEFEVASQHPEVVEKIEAYLKASHVDSAEFPVKETPLPGNKPNSKNP